VKKDTPNPNHKEDFQTLLLKAASKGSKGKLKGGKAKVGIYQQQSVGEDK